MVGYSHSRVVIHVYQDCVDTKDGFHCQCRQGYKMGRNKTCEGDLASTFSEVY